MEGAGNGMAVRDFDTGVGEPEIINKPLTQETNRRPGFPYVLSVARPTSASGIYTRLLLASGHGYPLYIPGGNRALPAAYLTNGTSIGDVGILKEDGVFSFGFNIFLPADHPCHKGRSLPRHFSPMPPLDPSETRKELQHFSPGTIIMSPGISVTRHSFSPLKISAESSAKEGAMLLLPDGASREDLVSTEKLHAYAKEHAADWYQYFNNYGLGNVYNGSVYIVTGVDKTSSWCLAAFPIFPLPKASKVNLYRDKAFWRGSSLCATDNSDLSGKEKPSADCVFLRGTRIALGEYTWLDSVQEGPEDSVRYSELLVLTQSPSPLAQRLVQRAKAYVKREKETCNTRSYEIYPYHPSDILAQILLSQCPTAEYVFLNDVVWSVVTETLTNKLNAAGKEWAEEITTSRGTAHELSRLLLCVLGLHDIKSAEGVLTLVLTKQMAPRTHPLVNKKTSTRCSGADAIKRLTSQGHQHLSDFPRL